MSSLNLVHEGRGRGRETKIKEHPFSIDKKVGYPSSPRCSPRRRTRKDKAVIARVLIMISI